MSDELERVRHALEGIVRADEDLQIAAERHREMSLETARRLENGTENLTDVLVDLNAAERRQEVNDAIEGFESARHAVRLSFFALGRTQGAGLAEKKGDRLTPFPLTTPPVGATLPRC